MSYLEIHFIVMHETCLPILDGQFPFCWFVTLSQDHDSPNTFDDSDPHFLCLHNYSIFKCLLYAIPRACWLKSCYTWISPKFGTPKLETK